MVDNSTHGTGPDPMPSAPRSLPPFCHNLIREQEEPKRVSVRTGTMVRREEKESSSKSFQYILLEFQRYLQPVPYSRTPSMFHSSPHTPVTRRPPSSLFFSFIPSIIPWLHFEAHIPLYTLARFQTSTRSYWLSLCLGGISTKHLLACVSPKQTNHHLSARTTPPVHHHTPPHGPQWSTFSVPSIRAISSSRSQAPGTASLPP
ncbi:hypothetical protein BDP55DRAFT_161726 [Colletotrichum godetiae]|uniref:Uncharacterized protein n=1 Tax=Colletotrichum godetiae TaxID=1209918 RepID=A0AAJ0AL64_9PEZI|nr:uncharacterized protein BDP55DRAFT_161726 [Colletotrichum godetiae]KAK1675284.1 hypothetical protein BDP55DRAFT_161726 [Colletotrichum godetiae]